MLDVVIVHIGRYTEIEKANRILLERMTTIMSHSGQRSTFSGTPQQMIPPIMQKRSLNSDVRRKELMKITIEN